MKRIQYIMIKFSPSIKEKSPFVCQPRFRWFSKEFSLRLRRGKFIWKRTRRQTEGWFEVKITGANCDRRDAWPSNGRTPPVMPQIPSGRIRYPEPHDSRWWKTDPDKKQGASVPSALHRPGLTHHILRFFAPLPPHSFLCLPPPIYPCIPSFPSFSTLFYPGFQTPGDIRWHVTPTICKSIDYSKQSITFEAWNKFSNP